MRVAVRPCRLCASVWPCKSQQSIVSQSALVICRRMQGITLFTFCLQYIGLEFRDFAGKFDILSLLLKSSQNMIYLDCDNDTDHDPPGPASTARNNKNILCAHNLCVVWVFSKSGILMSPLKSRMSSKTLEMRTFLKSNYGFVANPAPVAKTVEISSKQ